MFLEWLKYVIELKYSQTVEMWNFQNLFAKGKEQQQIYRMDALKVVNISL